MIKRELIIDKIVSFANNKLSELSSSNPMMLIGRPFIARAINNNIYKLDSLLKMVQDKEGNIDIEGILSETIDNLLIANIKKYPNFLGGLEIGEGNIKINIPFLDKSVVLTADDIEEFKNSLTTK